MILLTVDIHIITYLLCDMSISVVYINPDALYEVLVRSGTPVSRQSDRCIFSVKQSLTIAITHDNILIVYKTAHMNECQSSDYATHISNC
jgi:hypothetical protein